MPVWYGLERLVWLWAATILIVSDLVESSLHPAREMAAAVSRVNSFFMVTPLWIDFYDYGDHTLGKRRYHGIDSMNSLRQSLLKNFMAIFCSI
jgi:hypothetical protein